MYLPEFLIKNLKLTYHVVANFVLDASIMKSKKKQKQTKKNNPVLSECVIRMNPPHHLEKLSLEISFVGVWGIR